MATEPDALPAGAEPPMRAIGRRLEAARRRRGWSYREFEERTGMSRSTLQYLVRRRQTAPDYYELTGLVRALGETWDAEWEQLWRRAVDAEPADQTGGDESDTATRVAPFQLPGDVSGFAGRAEALAALDDALGESAGDPGVLVAVVSGAAGVGKTALAIHWGRQAGDALPDGQLYVNLRGYDPEQPMTSREALAGFLRALGVADRDLPADLEERTAAFRTLTESRRLLVVLDNASSAEQVRPLLPGSSTCRVVVTSRDLLPGLIARDGAVRVDLDLLPEPVAVELLHALIGGRVDAEPDHARTLAAQCARLPLALRIAAEYASSRSDLSLAELVEELSDHRARLDALDAGDPHTAVRSVFSWSYVGLPADAAKVFRRIGLHPGDSVDAVGVAALADTDVDAADRLLRRLTQVHLVEPVGRRYGMHDLLRAYAAERVRLDDGADAGDRAMRRLLDHYLRAAADAMDALYPEERRVRPTVDRPSSTPLDAAAARAWLDAERRNLVAVVAYSSVRDGLHATLIAQTVSRYLEMGGFADDAVAIHGHALEAARRRGDRASESHADNNLGVINLDLGRYDQAESWLRLAIDIRRSDGDRTAEARSVNNLGIAYDRMGRYDDARACYEQSLAIRRDADDTAGQAQTLGNLGVICVRIGRHRQADEELTRALELFQEVGSRASEAYTWDNLAGIAVRQGALDLALTRADQALPIFRDLGIRDGEATSLGWGAVVAMRRGEYRDAAVSLRSALAIQREIGARDGEVMTLGHLGELAVRQGQSTQALDHHRAAVSIAGDLGDPYLRTHARNDLGDTLLADDQPEVAHQHYVDAHVEAEKVGVRYELARALVGLGEVARRHGEPSVAKRQWSEALEIFIEVEVPEAEQTGRRLAELGA